MVDTIVKYFHKYKSLDTMLRIKITCIILVAGVGLSIGVMALKSYQSLAKITANETYASQILTICKNVSYKPSCYEEQVLKLMNIMSMEGAFEVTRLIQEKDPFYPYCHALGHKLSFKETQSGADWKDVLIRCPLAMCNYGCLHGSLIEHFRGEVLTSEQILQVLPDLQNVCEKRSGWNPSRLDMSMCYHALGHLAMYITGADMTKTTDICKAVSVKSPFYESQLKSCIGGVFMTLLYAADPEDRALVKDIRPDKDNVMQFCRKFTDIEYQICRQESASFYEEEFLQNSNNIVSFCSFALKPEDIQDCYFTVMNRMTDSFIGKANSVRQMAQYCDHMSGRTDLCYSGFALRMIQIDKKNVGQASDLCGRSGSNDIRISCYNKIVSYGTLIFSPGSSDFRTYCMVLPSPYVDECLGQIVERGMGSVPIFPKN
ncbi:MAG: hypothetical protein EXS47_01085 [Candidatus Zambryskibacteria bacterium]|nr:hypothetical protein [Candidatus Zambryskibacteria bacterium]